MTALVDRTKSRQHFAGQAWVGPGVGKHDDTYPHPRTIVMRQALLPALACLVLAGCFGETAQTPTVAVVQAAYDSAKLEDVATHDDQLLIRQTDCRRLGDDKFTCQVGFTDRRSTGDRLYFDVIGLDRVDRAWKLVSGLCRRQSLNLPG
jgi:hypothetical protein